MPESVSDLNSSTLWSLLLLLLTGGKMLPTSSLILFLAYSNFDLTLGKGGEAEAK